MRAVRNNYLKDTDYTQLEDAPVSEDKKEQYRAYRQYLREYPDTENWWKQNPKTFEDWAK